MSNGNGDNRVRISKKMVVFYSAWLMAMVTVVVVKHFGVSREEIEWAVKLIMWPTVAYLGGQSAVDTAKAFRNQ